MRKSRIPSLRGFDANAVALDPQPDGLERDGQQGGHEDAGRECRCRHGNGVATDELAEPVSSRRIAGRDRKTSGVALKVAGEACR